MELQDENGEDDKNEPGGSFLCLAARFSALSFLFELCLVVEFGLDVGFFVVHYNEFKELIQPFEDPERVSQLDRKLLKTTGLDQEFLCMFMAEIAKRHDEHSNLIKEIHASTDFTLRNQQASIKALEIQTISTSVKTDMPLIHRIDASQYTDELKEIDGEKGLQAHYTNAKPFGKALPRKEKDPGSFTLPYFINNMCFNKALANLGASVSVMSYWTYTTLGLGDLIPTKLIVELADRTVKRPKGIVKNVLVGIDKFTFPLDFIILDIPEDFKTPLILGRPFLSVAHAIINMFKAKITLSVGNDKIFFKSNKPTTNIIKRVYALSLIRSTELDLEARLMGNVLRKNRSHDPKFEDFLELNDLNEALELSHDQVVDLGPTVKEG
ncbi:reverse transcriptase domain-containing protein [Tanacetum coccineum]